MERGLFFFEVRARRTGFTTCSLYRVTTGPSKTTSLTFFNFPLPKSVGGSDTVFGMPLPHFMTKIMPVVDECSGKRREVPERLVIFFASSEQGSAQERATFHYQGWI